MPVSIEIRGLEQLQKVGAKFRDLETKLPLSTSKAMQQWGNLAVHNLKTSAKLYGKIKSFEGESGIYGRGIRWEQANNGKIGRLFIVQHGLQLDSMKSHFVSVRASRSRLLTWMLQAGNHNLKKVARAIESGKRKRYGLYVKPHPFIQRGLRMSRPQIPRIVSKQVNFAIKQALRK